MRVIRLLLILLLATLGAPAWASQIVVFEDGRELVVESADCGAEMAVLTLAGGARLSVPAARVARWYDLPAEPEAPPVDPPTLPPAGDSPWRAAAGRYADLIAGAAERHRLDPALLTAVAEAESNFNARAVSHKGAGGLLQLMPATAARFGVRDVFDPTQNVEGGARYLSWLLRRFEGDTALALAGYNAGEGAVDRHRGLPPYPETRLYVERVLRGAGRLGLLAP